MPVNLGSIVSQYRRLVGGRSIGYRQARGLCSSIGRNVYGAGEAVGVQGLILRGIALATGYSLGIILPGRGDSAQVFEEKLMKDVRATEELFDQIDSRAGSVSDRKF
ncbi:predicted protein [Arabidopsis lyrata subsp. lyrata]|uniref:Predicted protein n=1 Tax=Arabidopsis lyrata subsp. lyrata TaxID=81972 RepID=D7L166_ARALL|nr:uncharacterized protein LOC9320456 isoform X1 [Arabidopsis lyrata subsp. lyrata]EFH60649.1 predicted protein [Arabidopsis lyrata subsp. lyrata]|eukprot:XP_002884390.1 uncharacterized protein LOC9320456 isoform X1 [Arabidopsis lyrata subsp. lyrata]